MKATDDIKAAQIKAFEQRVNQCLNAYLHSPCELTLSVYENAFAHLEHLRNSDPND
jgi:hypothetical protein